jgi:hypothetical protein
MLFFRVEICSYFESSTNALALFLCPVKPIFVAHIVACWRTNPLSPTHKPTYPLLTGRGRGGLEDLDGEETNLARIKQSGGRALKGK